ncbi:MAG: hypothetical protein MJ071_02055 [Oscillospiraceae bacterium]|nr:hypothetical protein [Oscillospiraceae bacterium]
MRNRCQRFYAAVCLISILNLSGCSTAASTASQSVPVVISETAEPWLHMEDGYSLLDEASSQQLQCQMLLPGAMGWYGTSDGVVRYCDSSGTNCATLEYRSGDDFQRCYETYLHDIGCRLPAGRMQTYELQTIGAGAYSAYRIDARVLEESKPEHMITYWFIDKPHREGKREGCYIVTLDTIAENLECVMNSIQTFSLLRDFHLNEQEAVE